MSGGSLWGTSPWQACTTVDLQVYEVCAHLVLENAAAPAAPDFARCVGIVSQFDQSIELAEVSQTFSAADDT